jgi:hypothetical protein
MSVNRRIWPFLGFALHVLGCSPLTQLEQQHVPAPSPRPNIEEAIRTARARFKQVAESGNASAMAFFFTADGLLITRAGDTIRGRDAIEHYFTTVRPGAAAATFWFLTVPLLQVCTDGAHEYGGYTAVEIRYADHPSDTLFGRLGVRWRWDSLGDARVQWAAFSDRGATRRVSRSECVDPAFLRHESSRMAVTLFQAASTITGGPASGLKAAMVQQGWNQAGYVCSSSSGCASSPTPWSGRSGFSPVLPVLGSFRYRFSRAVATDVTIGALPQGWMVGLDTVRSAELEILWSGFFAGALLSYERWRVHVSAGPAVQSVHWRVIERNHPYNATVAYQTSSYAKPVGLVAELGMHLGFVGRIRLDLRAQARRFAKAETPGTSTFMPAKLDFNSSFVGLGFSVVF